MAHTYSILNAPTAAAAGITISGRKLSIESTPGFTYPLISGYTKQAAVTEVLQISTVAFTAANNTTYRFNLQQMVDGFLKSLIVTYISDGSGTAAEIDAAFTAQITKEGFKITPSGAGTPLTLTAQAGYPLFTIANIENTTVATGTAGVEAKGTVAKVTLLIAGLNNTGTDLLVSGNVYTQYQFVYGKPTTPSFNIIDRNTNLEIHDLFVNEGAAGYALFDVGLNTNIMQGYEVNAGVANVVPDADCYSII